MTYTLIKSALAATSVIAEDTSTRIDLTYVWTAHEGQAERLIAAYTAVGEALEANELGLVLYEMAVSESGDQIVIHEVFEDGNALVFHLSETAAAFVP